MACASCGQKYAALRASRQARESLAKDSNAPRKVKPQRRRIIRSAQRLAGQAAVAESKPAETLAEESPKMSDPTPIIPTEGVSVGAIVPKANEGLIDPSTGQQAYVIKNGKQSSQGSDIDGCPQPESLGTTPPLDTPTVK